MAEKTSSERRDPALTAAARLSEKDLSFSDEIMEMDGRLNFYINTDFDVDKVFGTNVQTLDNDDWINVYVNFDMESRQVCDTLDIELHRGDGGGETLSYPLNAAEKSVFYAKMDAYCREQNGISLPEYCDALLQEQDLAQAPSMG
ncbi:hypothetical protein [Faecalispora jeddahensis]|uniref:hypothetical protein n=1 Tax=Faecalispora jeddahensis TaxID=1414721 RepID=UPI001897A058|nr:hypothetical protein [Faecalispora jeddahensis]